MILALTPAGLGAVLSSIPGSTALHPGYRPQAMPSLGLTPEAPRPHVRRTGAVAWADNGSPTPGWHGDVGPRLRMKSPVTAECAAC